ncbi:MAG: hypothetical protein ACKESB_01485 [Candidatus Hodgkinia cicadicola]
MEYLFYKVGISSKPSYFAKLLEELSVISNANYSGYFLIVSDFVL